MYVDEVLLPKNAFAEDFFDSSSVVKCENHQYSVPKFKMVTVKLLGNILVCDDRQSVTILDARNL